MPQINTKISDETYRQIRWLREHRSYSLRDVMTIAVDRIYREQETNMTENLRSAVEEAIRECEHWMNGAAVIRCTDGTIEAVPNLPPLRDDVIDTILELTDPHDIAGYDCELERDEENELTDEMVAWIADLFFDNYQPD